ncbi:MAG: response regulator [Desulfobacteraceae bacterium]|nr:response regulator [Desulfobacteraceae bacterium]
MGERKILLIEDNPADAILIREMLDERGGSVLAAVDRLAAGLELLRAETIAVVLLDLGLPDSSGLETLLRIQAASPEVPVIVLTGLADEELAARAIGQGAQDFLVKGRIDSELLARTIRYAVERKKSQLLLKRSEERFRAVFDQMTEGLVIFDPEGNLLDMNPAARSIYGFESGAPSGVGLRQLTRLLEVSNLDGHPLEVAQWPIGRVLKGETIKTYEVRVRRRDTGKAWISSYGGAPVRDREGRVLLNILTMRDITAGKKAEEELQKAQKLESIGLLAGGIAHDFNNILTAILGNITLARMFLPPGDKAVERLVVAEQASMRARGLSQQLLTFARGGAPITETLAVPPLVRETVALVLRGARVKAECSFSPDLLPVEADESQLAQAISNLLLNGVQAMPEGGILEARAANISLSGENTLGLPAGTYVRIDIRDQGSGIPEEARDKIFDPYFTTKERGTGLGLTISFSIVKRHGGTITFESSPGKGSTFSIYLPASGKKIAAPGREEIPELQAGAGRVLVMDDEETISEIAGEMLRHLGYRVETARSGAEAITAYQQALAARDPFDAVIADLTVPAGMGGKEMVRRLLTLDPRAKVIVSSGYRNDPVMADFAGYGFKGAIAKPYRLTDLERALREALGKREEE